ncbi:HAD-IB family hydrolase [Saxibacter everestensis]|uniref:HAD-IB family hydrolase n=1 Tax=Saxibacter everestensis TaxID=2909229 RepID=A0ABY8QQ66_9MICO|nr:HAD-IB family hydrolase [Brevibacteriaceae bacterium ZFBP1038]
MPISEVGGQGSTPAAAEPSTAAAFFDVDNTFMRGASLFHLARGMRQRRLLSYRDLAQFAWQQVKFIARGEHTVNLEEVRQRALSFVAGYTVADIRQIGEEVYDEFMDSKIWPGTKQLSADHLNNDQQVWLVTATPVEIAEVIAARLGVTGGLGTVAEHVDGVYTGQLTGQVLHGEAKAAAVQALAAEHGFDLSISYAYSDSANDIPMLSLVGNPFAINPDLKLRIYAEAHGWEVRDFRTAGRNTKRAIQGFAGAGALYGGWRAWRRLRGRRSIGQFEQE